MRSRRTAPILLLAFLLFPLAVGETSAQEPEGDESIDTPYRWIPHPLRLGVYGGYLEARRTDLGIGPGPTPVVGARLRGRVSSPLSLEANVSYGRSERLEIDPRLEDGPGSVGALDSDWVLVEGGVHFGLTGARTWNSLQPYAVFGAGLLLGVREEPSQALDDPELSNLRYEISSLPSLQVGLGTEWLISDRYGVGFEFRDHLWRIATPEGFFAEEITDLIEAADAPAPEESRWTHNLELSITVWRYF